MKYIFLIFVFSALAIFIFASRNNRLEAIRELTESTVSQDSVTGDYAPQVKKMGEVDVEVEPINLSSGSDSVFKISLNTHSVDLSYDFTKVAKLTDDKGNSYAIMQWRGGSEGHHLEGELSFAKLKDNVSKVLLTLDGIDNQRAQFTWELRR